jgi:hypothetical protein
MTAAEVRQVLINQREVATQLFGWLATASGYIDDAALKRYIEQRLQVASLAG